ncbi:adenosylcobalamin/alpha-ribazole phosphatase [Enterobacteriaceae bacterium H11S18]|uniref:adenosylcobalamin/alpha-ribazole phosphatase n=1 Tax=Dryocola clanedunensis TaxID=2925396 RepID=UPI0022F0C41F|nr:adenosylcobalamin/alpha-ribazole phosphatase [Dryocola clanedunensis]MCT4704665.1 adenosylcobalamin/alpha-ribazole phosphatase [Dryocola clanedunensis]MCT4709378.1 adenosylcobalamin/alpha-ribazole phosphatase [Dryocola clanedunensis]
MTLWLVRHGQTHANLAGLYSGASETELTGTGIIQAQAVGKMLASVPLDRVLCSELGRAKHTAKLILQQRDIPVAIEPRLNEMNFGDWEMRHHSELKLADAENYAAWCQDWQNVIPGNGEGFQLFAQRVASFSESIKQTGGEENILIVSHQGVLSLLIASMLNMPAASLWHFLIEQGAWSAIDIHEGFATLRTLNNRAEYQALTPHHES